MSTSKNATDFIQHFLNDPSYAQGFTDASPDAILAKAKADGFELTAEELAAALKENVDPKLLSADLSEDDLEKVTGGSIGIIGLPSVPDMILGRINLLGRAFSNLITPTVTGVIESTIDQSRIGGSHN